MKNLLKNIERRLGTKRAAALYYEGVYRLAPRLGVTSFNYGYAEVDETGMRPEPEAYQRELYRQTGLAADAGRLADACVLEISCGLGGGLAHLVETFGSRLAVGVDVSLPGVLAARRRFGLVTAQADAIDLRLPAQAFDVVVNVEASHIYFGDAFLSEVARVLRAGGRFVLTDSRFMPPEEIRLWLTRALASHGLRLSSFRDITANVARACELDTPRRESLLARAPFLIRAPLREMLGGVTTRTYAMLRNGEKTYFIAAADKDRA